MIKLSYLLALIMVVCLQSCNIFGDNCEDYACFTPPQSFHFELINSQEENALSDPAFDTNKLKVIRLEDEQSLNFDIETINEIEIIQVQQIGWEEGLKNYQFLYEDNALFVIRVDAESVSEDCCSFTQYNEKSLLNAEHTIVTNQAIDNHYRVTVDY
ncbi:hypothetical protein JKA74_00990 [Marivirga sp. S37H4]|uniref:Uncharacterized protein n=1 Tax=Marivirga aurantiaca TaxID=2802615 RepID=A0A935C687_9BACT|nr:hypothetical protein [Marivirga aurantiaca]MBK6263592.1 hypothetical protein [Marivirga aurantiaca]